MNNYRIVYQNELNHYGVRGMKWGVRKQSPLVGRRQGSAQKPQLNDAQRRQVRRQRAKKAAIIGGTLAVAGLAAYGTYKYKKLSGEMRDMNSSIRSGKAMVNALFNYNGSGHGSVQYLGNDFKYHTAQKTKGMYTNYGVTTQQTYDKVLDYARAKKRYTGRY